MEVKGAAAVAWTIDLLIGDRGKEWEMTIHVVMYNASMLPMARVVAAKLAGGGREAWCPLPLSGNSDSGRASTNDNDVQGGGVWRRCSAR